MTRRCLSNASHQGSRGRRPGRRSAEAALADRAGGVPGEEWWRLHATTVAALAPLRPGRVLTLLERHGPHSLPPALNSSLGPLVTADAERLVRWITSPGRQEARHEPVPPPGVMRRLVRAAPESLPALGRHWLRRHGHFAALLKAMAPARRPEFLDAATSGGTRGETALGVLHLLPRERRWAEVRRAAAAYTDESWSWWDDLDTLAHGPLDEARSELLAAVRRPDADDRALAWPLLVACAARDGGREAITELLTTAGRLRNDQDPVRAAALDALAGVHPRLSGPGDAAPLDRIAANGGTTTGLLAAGLVTGAGVLLGWPEEWRSLLRLLRGHPHPDVRHEAYRTMTESE